MGRKPKAEHHEPAFKARCPHHWIIESARGPTSRAVCKFCGAETVFRNYVPRGIPGDRAGWPSALPDLSRKAPREHLDGFPQE